MNYFYGPVSSRRLGLSLGVDLMPKKLCTFGCLYCQLGETIKKTQRRFSWVDLNQFKKELKRIIKARPKIDYITISGAGEPTLHKGLDKIIKAIKVTTGNRYQVCLITNSSLLYRPGVRKEILGVDLIIPSLDAGCEETFRKINRPDKGITLRKVISGLRALHQEFKGKIWLEVMLVKGVNDSIAEAEKIKEIVKDLRPDKVQLNLPVRPSAIKLKLPDVDRLSRIKQIIGSVAEVVSDFYDGRKQFMAYRKKTDDK